MALAVFCWWQWACWGAGWWGLADDFFAAEGLQDQFFPRLVGDDGDVVDAPIGAEGGHFGLPGLQALTVQLQGGGVEGEFGVGAGFHVYQF